MRYNLYTRTYRDRNGEPSTVSVRLRRNFTDDAEKQSALSSLGAAFDGVSSGLSVKFTDAYIENLGQGKATAPNAHRENKLVVFFYDTVTYERYSVEVPIVETANLTFQEDSDKVVITAAPMSELVVQMEANVVSKNENPIKITGAKFVGRNL